MSASVFFSSVSELATVSNVFSVNGTPTNPTAVTLTITSPSNVVTTPTATNTAPGAYTADVTCDEDGTWQYQWVGTGAAVDTVAGTWPVLETDLGRLYCPIEVLKSRLDIDSTADDAELHAACFAASRWVEQYTERVFWRSLSQSRTFVPRCASVLLPAYCDLVSATAVKTDTAGDGTFATTLAAGTYRLLPYNPAAGPETQPYNEVRLTSGSWPAGGTGRPDTVQITGVWGWPKVPAAIRQAAAIVAADTFRLKDSPFGVQGEGEFVVRVGDNRRAQKFLDPYKRYSVLVA